ncbi:MAG TPA: alpha/beta fold hydrolase [Burkholderiaceae bacterium]|nr:alpha/beta fold hydrolase [Burkholderiaceae bacterium]HMX11878.1 alpha/beta fold hydrolase [Burkholderiaceae bacterium]HMZ02559.1 alpha/beta fold hydrolase [Burkholderiaceae bacterium]HNB47416.1 alpha/beta fold hydrolase [Burkholderiaceae bacterium]HNG79132.1 alpha/beta fold hydrolase [Burkholderiaceae bacterium]
MNQVHYGAPPLNIPAQAPFGPRCLHLPGWLDSDAAHWQARWWQRPGHEKLEQADWQWPRRGDWMARLDEALLGPDARPVLLIAHSLGCQLVAAWAEHSVHTAHVAGALLVAPPDTERPDMPPQLHNWRPMRRARLPFPALAVISSDDPYCDPERARGLCADWGAEVIEAGARGHLNATSGLGDWPEGLALLDRLVTRVGAHG